MAVPLGALRAVLRADVRPSRPRPRDVHLRQPRLAAAGRWHRVRRLPDGERLRHPQGPREQRSPGRATGCSRTSTTSTTSTRTSSSATSGARSPSDELVQPERDRRRRQPHGHPPRRRRRLPQVDQRVVDGLVLSTGTAAEERAATRHIQTGQVQQYAALLFGGAVAPWPSSSSSRSREQMKSFSITGGSRSRYSCPRWAWRHAGHSQGRGAAHKVIALAAAVGVVMGITCSDQLRLRPGRRAAVLVNKPWIPFINSRYNMGLDGISLPR